jgi:hypothetical protein
MCLLIEDFPLRVGKFRWLLPSGAPGQARNPFHSGMPFRPRDLVRRPVRSWTPLNLISHVSPPGTPNMGNRLWRFPVRTTWTSASFWRWEPGTEVSWGGFHRQQGRPSPGHNTDPSERNQWWPTSDLWWLLPPKRLNTTRPYADLIIITIIILAGADEMICYQPGLLLSELIN